MRVIVSDTLNTIEGYKVKTDFDGIVWGTVDTLIFHSCSEMDVKLTCALSSIPETVKIIYINEHLDPLLYEVMKGKGAIIYNDESFLADKETLDFLVDNAGSVGCEVKDTSADMETLNKFFNKIRNVAPDEAIQYFNNPQWVATLDNVVENISTSLTLTDQSSPALVTFLDNINSHILRLEEKNTTTTKEIQKLRDKINSLSPKGIGQQVIAGNKAVSFGTYTVSPAVQHIMYVRCFGDMQYLTSFLIAFQTWLGTKRGGMNTPSKLLIVRPAFANYMLRYSKVAKITPQSATAFDTSKANVYVTYEPNKTVLDAFFKEITIPVYIVVDFLQAESPLLVGHMIKTFNAYSSPRIYKELTDNKLRAPVSRSLFAIDGVENSLIIPYIQGWQEMNEVERRGAYYKQCKPFYEKIYGILVG